MAIEFARTHVIGRSSGHSAVRAAAYRAGERLFDVRTGRTADYAHRAAEVAHREVLLPAGADPALADRTTLWTAVEAREDAHNRRASAQLALDHIVALPRELPLDQQIALARDYAQAEYVSKGVAVDLAVHLHSDGNPHAHLMTTTRYLDADGFGKKASELSGRFAAGRKVADEEGPRHRWAAFQNMWLEARGIELVVTNHAGEYPAERHLGPAHAIARTGEETTLAPARAVRVAARTEALLARPEIVIERVSAHRSLFTRRDLYRETGKLVDDPEAFQAIKAKLDASELLIRLEHPERGELLTTRAVLETEQMIRARGELLARPAASFALDAAVVARAIEGLGGDGPDAGQDRRPALSDEQRTAVEHLTSGARLGIVEGLAGAGKSTMLRAVRIAHEAAGHRVTGLALAGKAADELEGSSGIGSRTIHSWLGALERGATTLEPGEVVVVDEAGMVNNALMLRVMEQVEAAGAKLVLVGDAEQLQPIEAGCPLRDLAEQIGSVEIATIRRQSAEWQRAATLALARGDAAAAVEAYATAGHVHERETQAEAIEALTTAYLEAREATPEEIAERAVLAHRNADVAALNERIRDGLKARGALTNVIVVERHATELQPAARLELGVGDRVLFTKNDGRLGVRNGQLGTYRGRDKAGRLIVEQDGQGSAGEHPGGRRIAVDFAVYGHLVHGYAMTVHKAQGRTVERAFVLGSGSMDRHLGYVALSRHRDRVDVYVGQDELGERTLAEILGRARRQESALSFAERHGLEIEGTKVATPSRGKPSVEERLQAAERGDPAAEAWLLKASRQAHRQLMADAKARYSAACVPAREHAEAADRARREASAR